MLFRSVSFFALIYSSTVSLLIVPGCGEIYGIAQELSKELGVPVLDPRATVLKFAEILIEMSLSHSKKTYPTPPEKRREI